MANIDTTKKFNKVEINNRIYEIVPHRLTDGTHFANLPTLTKQENTLLIDDPLQRLKTLDQGVFDFYYGTEIWASPVSSELWHDIACFNNAGPVKFEKFNGTDWIQDKNTDFIKKPFIRHENQRIRILNSNDVKARWEWFEGSKLAWSIIQWLVIGRTYANPAADININIYFYKNNLWTLEKTFHLGQNNSRPFWFKLPDISGGKGLRIEVEKANGISDKGTFEISSIRLLTKRWGDQGQGSENQFPYTWDENKNIVFNNNVKAVSFTQNGKSVQDKLVDGENIKTINNTSVLGSGNISIPKGEDGITFTPVVSAEGEISWENDGNLPNPDPVNIKGPPGLSNTNETFFNVYVKPNGDLMAVYPSPIAENNLRLAANGDLFFVTDPKVPGKEFFLGNARGLQGPPGPPGSDGKTPIFSFNKENGHLIITNY